MQSSTSSSQPGSGGDDRRPQPKPAAPVRATPRSDQPTQFPQSETAVSQADGAA